MNAASYDLPFSLHETGERALWALDEYQELALFLATLPHNMQSTVLEHLEEARVLLGSLPRVLAGLRLREHLPRRRAEY